MYLQLYQEQFDMMLINKRSDSRQWNTYTALRIHMFDPTLSDSKLQNAATTTAHLCTLLENVFEKKQMIRGRKMWDQTDGCKK